MSVIKINLVVFFIIFLGNNSFAQANKIWSFSSKILKIEKVNFGFNTTVYLEKNGIAIPEIISSNKIDLSGIIFNCNDLAPFCKIEWQLEKAAKFPIKFRLGEVQYVEQMEGKY